MELGNVNRNVDDEASEEDQADSRLTRPDLLRHISKGRSSGADLLRQILCWFCLTWDKLTSVAMAWP